MDQKLTHIYEKKWRRINPYICAQCGKPRYSFIFTRAKEKICRSCARNQVPDNQPDLFGFKVKTNPDIPKDKIVVGYDPGTPGGDKACLVTGTIEEDGKIRLDKPRFKNAPTMTAEEAAKDLIRSDVERGDSCSTIQATWAGSSNNRYWASIVSGGKIEVKKLGKKELNPPAVFSLKKIYHEIVMEKKNKIAPKRDKQALKKGSYETQDLGKEIIKVAFGRKKK